MKLITGLGNPGQSYANNRHNIGFMCLNRFARTHGIRFDKNQGKARTGSGEIGGAQVVLARPQTYMNLSGESVSRLVKKFDVDLGDLIIIHDDLDLPLGKIRIRQDSGSGGHKGVESIVTSLESPDFLRLRVGIGRPPIAEPSESDIIHFVISGFTPEEKQTLTTVIPQVCEALFCLLTEGLTAAMNKYN